MRQNLLVREEWDHRSYPKHLRGIHEHDAVGSHFSRRPCTNLQARTLLSTSEIGAKAASMQDSFEEGNATWLWPCEHPTCPVALHEPAAPDRLLMPDWVGTPIHGMHTCPFTFGPSACKEPGVLLVSTCPDDDYRKAGCVHGVPALRNGILQPGCVGP